ncbi:MAG: prephenate dehydrogenase [Lachnospiraceae bacterium]|nr:prephenate dehydrogenase [Lachnospiraceae bacterium]
MYYEKIGFIGLGLIGGAIAKAICEVYPDIKIYAHASHIETIREAHDSGVIENADFLPLSEFGKMDLLFLCCPVEANTAYLKELLPDLSPDCLITDVGSVKGAIQREVEALGLSSQFIGGHPMTGSEKTGFSHSSAALLENAYYILTKNDAIDPHRVTEFSDFIASLSAIPLTLTCEDHDFATAAISHLPHVMSASLVNMVNTNNKNDILRTIAAGGFRDVTRIAASSPVMWRDICLENRDAIIELLSLYEDELSDFRMAIESSDSEALLEMFSHAKDFRDSITIKSHGLLPRVFEFYCDLDDEVGGIARVATLLAENDLSIKNVGIVHNREFQEGALHVEMYDSDSLSRATELLSGVGYTVHLR